MVSPTLIVKSRENIGPADTKEWNSPFSPHGSTPAGSEASSEPSNFRPANEPGNLFRSTVERRASRPLPIISRASAAVCRPHTGKTGVMPLARKVPLAIRPHVRQEQVAEDHVCDPEGARVLERR